MKIAHCTVLSAIIVLTVLTGSYMTLATGICERNPSATANEPGFPVLQRGSNGYYLR